jgi:hypothetical protein
LWRRSPYPLKGKMEKIMKEKPLSSEGGNGEDYEGEFR